MTSGWRIELSDSTVKALRKLDPQDARRITAFLHGKLAQCGDPRQLGKALHGELRSYWRYCVGVYRLICHIEGDVTRVLVVRVAHRREVYR